LHALSDRRDGERRVYEPLSGARWCLTTAFLWRVQERDKTIVKVNAVLYNRSVKIHEMIRPEDRIDHIAGHGVEPEGK